MKLLHSSRQILFFFLIATFFRILNDTMASGIFFTLTLKFVDENTAALVYSFSLLLTFIFSPLIGIMMDKKIINLKISAILYFFSGLGMILFLIHSLTFESIIFLNLILMTVATIPMLLYFNILSGLVVKGKPAKGYGYYSMTNTFGSIIGGILGAFLVTFDQSLVWWVVIKIILTIFVGLLFLSLKSLFGLMLDDNLPYIQEKGSSLGPTAEVIKDRGTMVQTLALTTLETAPTGNIVPVEITYKSQWKLFIGLLAISIFLLTLIRAFFLVIVAFDVFKIFNNDVFLYTTVSNLAALVTLVLFPFIGRFAEKIGTWNSLTFGVVIHTIYLGAFLILARNYLTVVLWVLPVWPIVEISYLGLITEKVSLNKRSQSIGIINSAIALGSMIGTYLITIFLHSSVFNIVILIPVFLPIIIVFLLLPIRYYKNVST